MNPVILVIGAIALQQPPSDSSAFLDAKARTLVTKAREARYELGHEIRSYTGTVKQRVGVSLRTPLKDRMLFRHESAALVRWSRDEEILIRVLGARQDHPGKQYGSFDVTDFSFDEVFDPAADRLYFGLFNDEDDDDDMWVEHPLAEGAERLYRYQSADTLDIGLPDGTRVRITELRVLPRENSAHLLSGSVWIEPATGAIVKAAFRLARPLDMEKDTNVFEDDDDLENIPGIMKPMEVDITMMSIEYAFWRLKHWLPRSMRMEGSARAGIFTAPVAMELAYQIDSVEQDGDSATSARAVLREWRAEGDMRTVPRRQNGRRSYVVVPDDESVLWDSPHLPPPIWESSPEFITEAELRSMYEDLAALPGAPVVDHGSRLRWGPQEKDLLRYNRVEGLSVGVRGATQVQLGSVEGVVRLGLADLHPNAEAALTRESLRRSLRWSVQHGLAAVDSRSLSLGSSAAALTLGRDDGEYYYATRAALSISPPRAQYGWYQLELFAQRDRPANRETNWSLPRAFSAAHTFRPNIEAERIDQAGATLTLRKWWGTQALGWQAGTEVELEGATGDRRYARGSATLRTAFPLFSGLRGALEAGAGSSEGELPIQRHFFLGGAPTLRGYEGSSAVGTSFLRARAELARTSNVGGFSIFADGAWAGARAAFHTDHALFSAGVGATLLDGLVRVDLARALRRPTGWRLELYLDALL